MIVLAYLAICIIWGTTYLAIKVALADFPPFLMGGIRFAIAALAFLPIVLYRKESLPKPRKQWWLISLTGILMLAGGNGLVNFAETYLDSGLTALTVATSPTWSAILGALFFAETEKLDKWSVVGIILATIGVYVLFSDDLSFANSQWPGVLAALACPVVWTFGSLGVRKHGQGLSPVIISFIQMLSGSVAFFLISIAIGESWSLNPSAKSVWAMAYLVVLGSIIAFTAYSFVLSKIPAARANTYTLVNPVIALIAGNLILDEPITPEIIPATILILGGLVLLYVMRNRARTVS
jgi:drug/metabolite transporter (DMT)-like permease